MIVYVLRQTALSTWFSHRMCRPESWLECSELFSQFLLALAAKEIRTFTVATHVFLSWWRTSWTITADLSVQGRQLCVRQGHHQKTCHVTPVWVEKLHQQICNKQAEQGKKDQTEPLRPDSRTCFCFRVRSRYQICTRNKENQTTFHLNKHMFRMETKKNSSQVVHISRNLKAIGLFVTTTISRFSVHARARPTERDFLTLMTFRSDFCLHCGICHGRILHLDLLKKLDLPHIWSLRNRRKYGCLLGRVTGVRVSVANVRQPLRKMVSTVGQIDVHFGPPPRVLFFVCKKE